MSKEFNFEKTVYLEDTNAFGNAYFARYFDWQGTAREEFFKQIMPNPKILMESGIKFITISASMEYQKEAVLYDEIIINVKPTKVRMTTFELIFRFIRKSNQEVIAEGRQKIGFTNASGKIIAIPAQILLGGKSYL